MNDTIRARSALLQNLRILTEPSIPPHRCADATAFPSSERVHDLMPRADQLLHHRQPMIPVAPVTNTRIARLSTFPRRRY